MVVTERKTVTENRTSVFKLTPVRISGVKLVKLTHKLSRDYQNPSSSQEFLFWNETVLEGKIEIPESLKKAQSNVSPESVFSFEELVIDEKPVSFNKRIGLCNLREIAYRVTSNKIAKPGKTYHVSSTEVGLYNCTDFYEDEIRTSAHHVSILVEKPSDIEVNATLWGQNASLHVLENSTRVYHVEIRGKLASGNGFTLHWRQIPRSTRTSEQNQRKGSEIDRRRIAACSGFASVLVVLSVVITWPVNSYLIGFALLFLIYAFTPQFAPEIIRIFRKRK
jgi:hypothetical protein